MIKKIGRKIYFEKSTGNIIFITSEVYGSVVETTTEQDFESYEALKSRVKDTVGVIQLEYGELSTEFTKSSGQKVDITKGIIDGSAIIFDYTPQVQEEMIKEKTLEEKVTVIENENTELKEELESTKLALAETVERQERDKTELQLVIAQMVENGGVVNG